MKIETKKVKLSEIKVNPDNPRTITKNQMANLVKSLKDFPQMIKLREIVVDEDMVVLGGNMRLLALREIGADECIVKIATGLTVDEKREFTIKDNANFGEWDMDGLAKAWGDLPLDEWGINTFCDYTNNSLSNDGENDQCFKSYLIGKLNIPKDSWFDSKESICKKIDSVCSGYGITVEWPQ